MAPSPRKRARPSTTPVFSQTWDDKDAAFLGPDSLPVTKIPRAWERKQEVTQLGEGKERKIWRRFNLRSRAANTKEDKEEEEHDSRSRAVKKLQHMSPKAMEKTMVGPNGRKRAFKATRWDRRKSVLPRKRTARIEDSPLESVADCLDEDNSEIENDIPDGQDANNDAHAVDTSIEEPAQVTKALIPEHDDRRATFTFTMDVPTIDALPDYESMDELDKTNEVPGTLIAEDSTLAHLFRSPLKAAKLHAAISPEKVDYPELPLSDDREAELEPVMGPFAAAEEAHHDFSRGPAETALLDSEICDRVFKLQDTQEATPASPVDRLESETTNVEIDPVEIAYPTLPGEFMHASNPTSSINDTVGQLEDVEMLEGPLNIYVEDESQFDSEGNDNAEDKEGQEVVDSEDTFTEASLQLDILREYEEASQREHVAPTETHTQDPQVEEDESNTNAAMDSEQDGVGAASTTDIEAPGSQHPEIPGDSLRQSAANTSPLDDITDGLTLSFVPARLSSAEPTRKLHSPPPPPRIEFGPDDATMTLALDDDTAILKEFLNRAAASKAGKAAIITRRESLQNRRDSDVVRHALASPRKVLEDKDPNSPSKYDNELTLDLSQTLTLSMPIDPLASPTQGQGSTDEEKALRGSRRSSRAKKSRLPAPASTGQAQTSKIAIRRADGNEVVVLRKNDVQELATLTRANTRKNKQGAFGVTVRLLKLACEAGCLPPLDDSTKELIAGKNIRWDEQLAYFQENPETIAEAESLATPDELSLPDSASTPRSKSKSKISRNSTPKIRRVRGLGTANGTPGKGLLAPASLLSEDVQEEKEAAHAPAPAPSQQLPRPKSSKVKKMPVSSMSIESSLSSNPSEAKLPTLEVVPVGIASTAQRKSRLAAPKKVMLPQTVSSLPSEGKENALRPSIGDATPKKGIPVPKIVVPPTVGMESGLPRRRGRKV